VSTLECPSVVDWSVVLSVNDKCFIWDESIEPCRLCDEEFLLSVDSSADSDWFSVARELFMVALSCADSKCCAAVVAAGVEADAFVDAATFPAALLPEFPPELVCRLSLLVILL